MHNESESELESRGNAGAEEPGSLAIPSGGKNEKQLENARPSVVHAADVSACRNTASYGTGLPTRPRAYHPIRRGDSGGHHYSPQIEFRTAFGQGRKRRCDHGDGHAGRAPSHGRNPACWLKGDRARRRSHYSWKR